MAHLVNSPLYFIIGGAGQVGYFLAKELLDAGHEVTILDKDARRVSTLRNEFSDAVVERGDACEVSVLEKAGGNRADYVLAVTGDDEDNLVMCQIAKARFNTMRTIARVNNLDHIQLFKDLGIDVVISPTESILDAIQTELPLHAMAHIAGAHSGQTQLIELVIPADTLVAGQTISSLKLPAGNAIVLLIRGEESFTPTPNIPLAAGDRLFAVVNDAGVLHLQETVMRSQED